jgi:pantoate--beta-alanine ligase
MQIYHTISSLSHYLHLCRATGGTVGFVPTMGALHEGHISLITESKNENHFTISSIFVNPTQFNNKEDLAKYPRTEIEDIDMLRNAGCDAVFIPYTTEIYPEKPYLIPDIDLNGMDEVMEGAFRPGHFKGVLQVVYILLKIVEPDVLYLGQKDFQQQAILRLLLDQQFPQIRMNTVATYRSESGLALSSRNRRLTDEQKEQALAIYKTLSDIKSKLPSDNISEILKQASENLETAGLKPEYISIADQKTLAILDKVTINDRVAICIAAFAGEIRLIDNMLWPED